LAGQLEGSRFYAFEADPALRSLLESNLGLNSLEDQVEVCGSRLGNTRKAGPEDPPLAEVESLDDFVAFKQLDRLDFIRVDGREAALPILEGSRNSLLKFQPGLLIGMRDPGSSPGGEEGEAVKTFCESLGYRSHVFSSGALYFEME
jgi:hypothetical protein